MGNSGAHERRDLNELYGVSIRINKYRKSDAMELYFIRHAIAVDRMDPSLKSDAERWLTDEGIQKMEKAAQGLKRIVPDLDIIFTSPYVRACQTADIVAGVYEEQPLIEEVDFLAPGADYEVILEIIQQNPQYARVGFTGHEPDFSQIISTLVTGAGVSDIEMKKGAVCRVDVFGNPVRGSGVLVWLLPPKALRKMC